KVLTMPVRQAQHPKILAMAWKKAQAKFQWLSEGHTGPDLVLPTRQPKASLLWGRWKSALRKQNILARPLGELAKPVCHADTTLKRLTTGKESKQQEGSLTMQLENLNTEHDEHQQKIPPCPCCGRRWQDTYHVSATH